MDAAAGRESSLLQAFITLLDAEEQALLEGNPARIEALAGEISACVQNLARFALPRAPSPALAELRAKARARNSRNGGLIAMRSARVQQRLDVLGARVAEGSPLYGSDGRFSSRA